MNNDELRRKAIVGALIVGGATLLLKQPGKGNYLKPNIALPSEMPTTAEIQVLQLVPDDPSFREEGEECDKPQDAIEQAIADANNGCVTRGQGRREEDETDNP